MKVPAKSFERSIRADLVLSDSKQGRERRKASKAIGKFGLQIAQTLLAVIEIGWGHAAGFLILLSFSPSSRGVC
jgi:hypothetical protein